MNRSICVFLTLLVIASCAPQERIIYHSTADIPLLSDLTISNLTYISGSREVEKYRGFGLFSAIDDNKTYYLLFAPIPILGSLGRSNPYARYDIARAVPIVPEKVKELLAAVRTAIQDSDSLCTKGNARFIELMIAPEQEVKPMSQNVVQWNPTLKFTYQSFNSKAVARLFFGEELFIQVVDLKTRRDLLDLESIIVLGIEDLKVKGCTGF